MNTKKSIRLLAILLFISFLPGCTGSSRKPWRNIKAAELISRQQPLEDKSMIVGLHIYLFRIQTNKLPQIQNQIGQTDTLPVKYDDPDAFLANGLISCAGDRASWQKIAQLVALSQPKTLKHFNILMTENMAEDVVIAETNQPISIVYRSNDITAGIGFDTGQTILRIKASSLIGLRQACRLDITPVYRTAAAQKTKKRSAGRENYESVFESAALNVHLQPGQFVLLAPARTQTDPNTAQTIGDILSSSPNPQKTANLCIIACNLINNPL
jgi:hypothetical protein